METAAQNFTVPHRAFFVVSFLPLLALALAGISVYFLYKHWWDLEPIHSLWAFFYGTQALNLFANDIAVALGHFTTLSVCPQNTVLFFTGSLLYLSVVLLQADRWAAIFFNSKYKGLITNKTAVVGCTLAIVIDLVFSIAVFLIDSSYVACAHPPSLRLTRRTTIYIEGMFKMIAVTVTSAVSCYAVMTKMKKNKGAPNVQLGHLRREENGPERRVRRARNTTDIFYLEQSSNQNVEAPDIHAGATAESNFLTLVKEIIESNKMPLIIVFASTCTPVIGWMYAGCEQENACDGFLSLFKFFSAIELFLIVVEIMVTAANIKKF